MTRAAPMPPEERRHALIQAALPILLTNGTVTTRQVADAAGVAEGTIFRVFESLSDLIQAATIEAVSADRLQSELADTQLGETLAEKAAAAIALLTQRFTTIRTVLMAAHHRGDAEVEGTCLRDELASRRAELDVWMAEHFAPHADELSVDPQTFVTYLRTIANGHAVSIGPSSLTPAELAHLALTGAGKEPSC